MKRVLSIADKDEYGTEVVTLLVNTEVPWDTVCETVEAIKGKWQNEDSDKCFSEYLKEWLPFDFEVVDFCSMNI